MRLDWQIQFKFWEGEATATMQALSAKGPFDLVFIDADKANYENYFNWSAKNLRRGGILLADNCFAFGSIAQTEFSDAREEKIRNSLHAFNVAVARHPDFRSTMIPTEEGLLFAVANKLSARPLVKFGEILWIDRFLFHPFHLSLGRSNFSPNNYFFDRIRSSLHHCFYS